MTGLSFKTVMQFPFFEIKVNVTYAKLKKPTGIEYIVLTLIDRSKTKDTALPDALIENGVPELYHDIFADSIQELFEAQNLESKEGGDFSKNEFVSYKISDYKLTDKGKKAFEDGYLFTIPQELQIPVLYDIAKKELQLTSPKERNLTPLKEHALTPEFMNRFTCEKNIEDFLEKEKSKEKIQEIKKDDIITKIEAVERNEYSVCEYDCSINIDKNSVSIEFTDPSLQKFFETNYTNEMINKMISEKQEFQFKHDISKNGLKLESYPETVKILRPGKFLVKGVREYVKINGLKLGSYPNTVKILRPGEITAELRQPAKIFVTRGNYYPDKTNKLVVENKESMERFDNAIEYIQVDRQNNIYAFVFGIFEFENDLFGVIKIPLVLKVLLAKEKFKEIITPYLLSKSSDYDESNFAELIEITGVTEDRETLEKIMSGYLHDTSGNNLVLLKKMQKTAMPKDKKGAVIVANVYKELLDKNYQEYLAAVNADNLETTLDVIKGIPELFGISPDQILDTIFEKLIVRKKVPVYETLVAKGFDKQLAAVYVNPVDEALKDRTATESTLVNLITCDDCINRLKDITKITDYKKYTAINEDMIDDPQAFKNTFNDADKRMPSIKKIFKDVNTKLFADYDSFMEIFRDINDKINMLEQARTQPNNITLESIERDISKGNYPLVFLNLAAKLERILKDKYKLKLYGNLRDMLSALPKAKTTIDDLHKFRIQRNNCIHPDPNKPPCFTPDDLRRWSKEISDLQ